MAAGLTNSKIGARLFLGEATVKTHIGHILRKLCARDRGLGSHRGLPLRLRPRSTAPVAEAAPSTGRNPPLRIAPRATATNQ